MSAPPRLVLASGSAIRRTILANAGLSVTVDPADIDEGAVKTRMQAQGAPAVAAAIELAVAKARAVSGRHPGALVIGADQLLTLGNEWFDKPSDRAAAIRHLERLSGRTHELVCGVAVVEDGAEIWRTAQSVVLHMRPLSRAFIEIYLDQAGDAVLSSVGAYQLEGRGAQLFTAVEGDYFTVLGLPLLSLLAFLRQRGIMPT
jgi:septum formation protein